MQTREYAENVANPPSLRVSANNELLILLSLSLSLSPPPVSRSLSLPCFLSLSHTYASVR